MEEKNSTCSQAAFQKLYDQFSDGLHRFIYYKSGDSGFAEDTVQEAFLRLWKNCATVPFEKAKSFLFTVGNNLFLDRAKHQKVRLKFQDQPQQTHSGEHPQYLLEAQEFKQELESAIAALPELQREVFLMSRMDQLKYREIAEVLGISQKAVEKRMHKALLQLRKTIGNI